MRELPYNSEHSSSKSKVPHVICTTTLVFPGRDKADRCAKRRGRSRWLAGLFYVRLQSACGPGLPFVLRTFMRYDLHNTRVET
jgi:hypothetical protein